MTKQLLLTSLWAGLAAQTTLDVHVYDRAQVDGATLEQASQVIAGIFRASGIQLRWILEPPGDPEGSKVVLVNPPRRGREVEAACAARRDIALLILPVSAGRLKRGVLGYAEPLAPAGVNATVFYVRVADAAHEQGIPTGVLLGHAIAHEIGHVLLRTAAHRKGGLMSGGWDKGQFNLIRMAGMFFEKPDARLMQSAISGEGCPQLAANK